jgi:phage tail sheath protein FI
MAALPYPGVTITVIDNSAAPTRTSTSVPAGVIGTAAKGPAFVPLNFSTYNPGFTGIFGESGNRFGPIAVNMWLNGALNNGATFIRVLGAGDGQKRGASGAVNRAGFVVGENQVGASGIVGNNPYATAGGVPGRTYFLGCFMSESAGSTYFSSAGVQTNATAVPIIRGVIMTPSGVALSLSGNYNSSNTPTATAAAGYGVSGSISTADGTFVMFLNGHISTDSWPNVITSSMATNSGSAYFSNTLNKDPSKLQEAGHYLYSSYDVPGILANITGSGIIINPGTLGDAGKQDVVFITSSSIGRDTSNATTPNFEQFRERYTHPVSPFVTSQNYGGDKYNLFRLHSISDGLTANTDLSPDLAKNLKVTISNISPATQANPFPTFSLSLRNVKDLDSAPAIFNRDGLTLDPNSTNYIASIIGDQNIYFDFDRNNGSQKIVVDGDYPVNNNYVRIEMSEDFLAGNIPQDAVPAGFRGYGYIFTSGSQLSTYASTDPLLAAGKTGILGSAIVPPVPVRQDIVGASSTAIDADLTWGTFFQTVSSITDANADTALNDSIGSYLKFFPSYDTGGKHFFVDNSIDANVFCNNEFSIEHIQVTTGALGEVPGKAEAINWPAAEYIRQGNITPNAANKTRALAVTDLLTTAPSSNRDNVAFTFFLQGGFDGTNIFDSQKASLTNIAAKREIDDTVNQGGVNGPTVSAYKKAIDVMGSTSDVTIQLLVMPGIRVPAITNYAISAIENRFDALYLMDIEQKNAVNSYITSSAEVVSISSTVSDFSSRGLNTSFAAAYFPDVSVNSPDAAGGTVMVPPSAAVLSAYAKNDTYAPWYAPAGTTRGVVPASAGGLQVPLTENSVSLGALYDADINPIVKLSSGGQTVVFGQKTLLKTASSLDRVNVRRLLIDIRRKVRSVANTLLFEPNTQATLARFNALVNPIMQDAQTRFGITRYKVIIDTSTTTQADIDNNTIKGKIFLQPVRTAEFISIDFVVNASSAT